MKYIYLDQKIWIDLARYIANREHRNRELLDKIEMKINNNEWAFPLSLVHQIETSKRLNDRSRKELSNVMGKYSNNYTIAPYMAYKSKEFITAFLFLHGIIKDKFISKNEIIKSDYANIIGANFDDFEIVSDVITSEIKEQLKENFLKYIKDKNLFSFYIENYSSKSFADEITLDLEYYAQCYKEAQKQLFESVPDKHKEYRYRIFLINCFREMFQEELQEIHSFTINAGIDVNSIFPPKFFDTKESVMQFFYDIPSFYVNTTLTYELLNNKYSKLNGNDYMDIEFLSIAIPYCDVIITERSWVSIAKKYKLNNMYDTQIFNNIDDLMFL